MMSKYKYSIIIIGTNQIHHTVNCIKSIYENTKDFELIVVDNFSSDGTTEYLHGLPYDNVKVIRTNRKETFAVSNNLGLRLAEGEYVIFLNNDTIVSNDWDSKMLSHFDNVPFKNIGAVGPVSNMSNGSQMVKKQKSEAWYEGHKGRWKHTGILYGWCVMVKKHILDEIGGFDERFENAWEDNDLSLRIQLAGYKLIIAYDTYIDHVGQGTLKTQLSQEEYMISGEKNRKVYFDKWANKKHKKLVAVYRTANGKNLIESLTQTSEFADSIILHFCRADFGDMLVDEFCSWLESKFPKIVKIGIYSGAFQEDYERNWLLQEALKLQEQGEADWCISIDDDEVYEDKFIDRVQAYMNPRNPEIMGYWCNWRTVWKKEMGKEYFRSDSTFGQFSNYRFFKLIKNQEIFSTHPEGHHCGSAPKIADENLMWCSTRVKHLGYDTPEQRQRKCNFYTKNDHFKTASDIGFKDYQHLVDKDVTVEVYDNDNTISCCMMVKNEEEYLLGCLENVMYLVDEFVIVDTGSTDKTIEIIGNFAKYSPVPVRLLLHPWEDNYSIPRNYGLSYCTGKWVLCLDADERIAPEHVKGIYDLTESDVEVWIMHVFNYLKKEYRQGKIKYASSESCRLFRNLPDFYYTGIIHETLDDSLRTLKMKRNAKVKRVPKIPLHHYGYLKKKRKLDGKLDYYESLNNRQIEVTEGQDARPFFNLALHHLQEDKTVDAMKNFQEAIKVNSRFHLAHAQMAALNLKNAKHFLSDCLNYMPPEHPFRGKAETIVKFLNENQDFGSTKVN